MAERFLKRFKYYRRYKDSASIPLVAPDVSLQHIVEDSFYFEGTNKKGVLLIHGWSTTPYETYEMATYLRMYGYSVYGLCLSGHGKTAAHLYPATHDHWVEDAEKGLVFLRGKTEKLYIVGNSMGGNLAAILASLHNDISGIVMTGTPYKIKQELKGRILLPIVALIQKYKKKTYPKNMFMTDEVRKHFIVHKIYPTKSALEAIRVIQKSRKILHKVHQPLLIVQSKEDDLVVKNNLDLLYSTVGSREKERCLIDQVYHNFLFDRNNTHVFRLVKDFIDRH